MILYDLDKGKAVSFFAGHSRPTNAVLFARNGAVAYQRVGRPRKGWQRGTDLGAEERHRVGRLQSRFRGIDAIALSADHSLLATGGFDKRVALWKVKALLKEDAESDTKAVAQDNSKGILKKPAIAQAPAAEKMRECQNDRPQSSSRDSADEWRRGPSASA